MKKIKFLISSVVGLLLSYSVIAQSVTVNDQQIILSEINHYRMQQGLPAVKLNSFLSEEATIHSRRMAEKIIPFSHDEFGERKNHIRKKFHDTYAIAENVAYNDLGLEGIVEQWINSSPHRRNIEGRYKFTGIGIAKTAHGRVYVTQIFVN